MIPFIPPLSFGLSNRSSALYCVIWTLLVYGHPTAWHASTHALHYCPLNEYFLSPSAYSQMTMLQRLTHQTDYSQIVA